jgi:hypothetical protein
LLGQASLVVNSSDGVDEYLIESIASLNFNDSSDSLFIYTLSSTDSYSILNIESMEFSGELSLADLQQLTSFSLNQNYPNPFNPLTMIRFEIDEPGKVRVDILNLKGQLVNTLVNKYLTAGEHQIRWDGKTINDSHAGSGLYIYRVSINDKQMSRQMIMLK